MLWLTDAVKETDEKMLSLDETLLDYNFDKDYFIKEKLYCFENQIIAGDYLFDEDKKFYCVNRTSDVFYGSSVRFKRDKIETIGNTLFFKPFEDYEIKEEEVIIKTNKKIHMPHFPYFYFEEREEPELDTERLLTNCNLTIKKKGFLKLIDLKYSDSVDSEFGIGEVKGKRIFKKIDENLC